MPRTFILAAMALAALAQAPRASAVPPVVAWCVSSPGALDTCSASRERILAQVEKRMAGAEDWAIGGQLTVTRVQ